MKIAASCDISIILSKSLLHHNISSLTLIRGGILAKSQLFYSADPDDPFQTASYYYNYTINKLGQPQSQTPFSSAFGLVLT